MAKVVVETVQVIKRKYYLEIENPLWALDSIVMNEVDHFSSTHMSEDIWGWKEVEEFPMSEPDDNVNGATAIYDSTTDSWTQVVRWDLCSK